MFRGSKPARHHAASPVHGERDAGDPMSTSRLSRIASMFLGPSGQESYRILENPKKDSSTPRLIISWVSLHTSRRIDPVVSHPGFIFGESAPFNRVRGSNWGYPVLTSPGAMLIEIPFELLFVGILVWIPDSTWIRF